MKNAIGSMALTAMLFACSQPANEKIETDHSKHSQEQAEELRLNGDEKWKVNEEMKPFLKASEELLNTYIASGDQDYKALATALKVENDKLIKSCTMGGEAHDQLHLWLYPHLVWINSLQKTNNPNKAQEIVTELKVSFELYHQYFE